MSVSRSSSWENSDVTSGPTFFVALTFSGFPLPQEQLGFFGSVSRRQSAPSPAAVLDLVPNPSVHAAASRRPLALTTSTGILCHARRLPGPSLAQHKCPDRTGPQIFWASKFFSTYITSVFGPASRFKKWKRDLPPTGWMGHHHCGASRAHCVEQDCVVLLVMGRCVTRWIRPSPDLAVLN
jgi:hypothetical protein